MISDYRASLINAIAAAFVISVASIAAANEAAHSAPVAPAKPAPIAAPTAKAAPKAPVVAPPPAATSHTAATSHWTYTGATGPEHWAELGADNQLCKTGSQQTPIDLKGALDAALPTLALSYRQSPLEIINNGHTVQVVVAAGQNLEVSGLRYQLVQYHFHAPSEHRVNGKSYEMELHLVHKSAIGELAVIGVFIKRGRTHPTLDRLLDQAPREASGKVSNQEILIDPNLLLPTARVYFHYQGSLTTPPCSEGVRWFVLKEPQEASAEQIARFSALFAGGTARPVQPLNSRFVFSGR